MFFVNQSLFYNLHIHIFHNSLLSPFFICKNKNLKNIIFEFSFSFQF